MGCEFKDLDAKIQNKTLLLKDITDKALAINVALRDKLPDNVDFRNPIIQGYIAWMIMYDYLSKNQDKLDDNILKFLNENSPDALSIANKLEKVTELLKKDFRARIRDDINALNEAEIITRSKTGVIYNYYTEDQKENILICMKNKSYLNEAGILKAKFYLVYRERDGRFFFISDTEINLSKELNIDVPTVVDITSTHITLNEGQNSREIFDKHFSEVATNELPCSVNSKDPLLYCGVMFDNVGLNLKEMYQLELCKNPAVEKVNILDITGDICAFKESLNFPILARPVALHINIGVTPRKMELEIANSEKSVLDLIDPLNPFVEPLQKSLAKYLNAQQDITYGRMFQLTVIENRAQENPVSGVMFQ